MIANFKKVAFEEQYITGFEITMSDSIGMEIMQSLNNLLYYGRDVLLQILALLLDVLSQRAFL